jgi:hypothetical protein
MEFPCLVILLEIDYVLVLYRAHGFYYRTSPNQGGLFRLRT